MKQRIEAGEVITSKKTGLPFAQRFYLFNEGDKYPTKFEEFIRDDTVFPEGTAMRVSGFSVRMVPSKNGFSSPRLSINGLAPAVSAQQTASKAS